jgi:hypothetical protein
LLTLRTPVLDSRPGENTMDFELSDEHRMLKDLVARFV